MKIKTGGCKRLPWMNERLCGGSIRSKITGLHLGSLSQELPQVVYAIAPQSRVNSTTHYHSLKSTPCPELPLRRSGPHRLPPADCGRLAHLRGSTSSFGFIIPCLDFFFLCHRQILSPATGKSGKPGTLFPWSSSWNLGFILLGSLDGREGRLA